MTRDEAIQAAGEVYGAILADPERREQIRQALAEQDRLAHQQNTRKSA